MNEFVEEVQDEWRRDQLISFWKRYGNLIIALILIVIALSVGNAIWDHFNAKKMASQTQRYENALLLIDTQQEPAAIKVLDQLIQEGTPGYKIFAQFKKVNLTSSTDDKIKSLQDIIKSSETPKIYKDLASYYLMCLKFDNTRAADFLHELKDYTLLQNYFNNHFLELKALTYYKMNQFKQCQEVLQKILSDKEITPLLRARVTALSNQVPLTK